MGVKRGAGKEERWQLKDVRGLQTAEHENEKFRPIHATAY